jgi:hypothetical protein
MPDSIVGEEFQRLDWRQAKKAADASFGRESGKPENMSSRLLRL